MRHLGFAAVAAILVTTPAMAQSTSDTTSVILATWDALAGDAPYGHPDGEAYRVCLESGLLGRPPRFSDLSVDALESLNRSLTEMHSVVPTTGCNANGASPSASRRDRERESAVEAQLTRLEFDIDGGARVGLHLAAGETWGGGSECLLTRDTATGLWVVERCTAVVHR